MAVGGGWSINSACYQHDYDGRKECASWDCIFANQPADVAFLQACDAREHDDPVSYFVCKTARYWNKLHTMANTCDPDHRSKCESDDKCLGCRGYHNVFGTWNAARGFAAFTQHFAALVAPFQVAPAPDPWAQPGPYLERSFPGARSMWDVVTAPGLPYLDHVALSFSRGLRKVGWLFQWAWLAVPLLVIARRQAGLALDARERVLLASFVGCLPFVLLAYPHIRYFARYFPLFWLLALMSVERLLRADPGAWRRPALACSGGFLALALGVGVQRTAIGLALAPGLSQYWFSD